MPPIMAPAFAINRKALDGDSQVLFLASVNDGEKDQLGATVVLELGSENSNAENSNTGKNRRG